MKRHVFYSFHYENDNWRASQVRNIGTIEGNRPVTDNEWEEIKKGGDEKIKRWILNQMDGKSCTVVLIGEKTANRKWINFEIEKSWELGMGILGIYIHRLLNKDQKQSSKGDNPLSYFKLCKKDNRNLCYIASQNIPVFDSQYLSSKDVYNDISESIEEQVEKAIKKRDDLSNYILENN